MKTGVAVALAAQGRFAEAEPFLGDHVLRMLEAKRLPPATMFGKDPRVGGIEHAIQIFEVWQLVEPDPERAAKANALRVRLDESRSSLLKEQR